MLIILLDSSGETSCQRLLSSDVMVGLTNRYFSVSMTEDRLLINLSIFTNYFLL
jgi:hypothetical protein